MHDRRNSKDKLKTLLFGKDLRITKGEIFTKVYPFDFSSYYPEDKYISNQPAPKHNVFDIRAFGANVDFDDNSFYINKAIDSASKCSGIVLVSGGDYVTTTVTLKSNVTLFIERGSALCANRTGEGYRNNCIVYAENASNFVLTGGGKLKGNGEYFGFKPAFEGNMTEHPEIIDVVQMRRDYRAQIRFAHRSKYGNPVYFKDCKNFSVSNFIIENSASWSFRIENCDNLEITNLVINNNRRVANTDGLDIAGSSNVEINHCFISTADDGICLKNAIWLGNDKAMENIHISNCEIITAANSFKIGTETTYDIKNVLVEDCSFMMTDLYPGTVSGIAIESADGSVVSDITVRNIKMNRVTCPIFIRLCNRNRAAEVTSESANAVENGRKMKKGFSAPKDMFNLLGEVKNIVIENIDAENAEIPCIIAGFRQNKITKYVENVTLKNINMEYAPYKEIYDKRAFIPEYADVYPESWRFRNLPAYGLWARHVTGLKLLDFNCSVPKSTWKDEYVIEDVK